MMLLQAQSPVYSKFFSLESCSIYRTTRGGRAQNLGMALLYDCRSWAPRTGMAQHTQHPHLPQPQGAPARDVGEMQQTHLLGAEMQKAKALHTLGCSGLLERLHSRVRETYFRCDKQQSLEGVSDLFIPQARGDIFLPSL